MNRRTNARGSSLICALILSVMAAYTHAAQTELPYTVASRYNAAGQLTGTIGPNPGNGHPATRYTYGTSGATKGFLLTVERGVLDVWSNENTAPASWTGFQVQVTT